MTSGSGTRTRNPRRPTARVSAAAPAIVAETTAGRVAVGRIVAAHGIRGELLVESLSDVPARFAVGVELILSRGDEPGRRVRVDAARPHKGSLLLALAGVGDRTAAEALRGALLEVEEHHVPPPPAGGYYYFQLEGCRCVDARDGDLGTVLEVLEGGGGTLLRVEGPRGELLLPFVDEYLEEVDVAGRRIVWQLPEGIVDPGRGA